jgi:hypothetical protein
MSFASMKKSRQAELDKLKSQIESTNKGGAGNRDNFWKPERDKAGNGQAIIRFLPAAEGDTTPWITYYDHWFKGPTGQYYTEKSLTTIGQDDPVSEFNSRLWNSGVDADKDQARAQKRKMHYVANILVIKDFANPENDNKTFQYRFGPKIFDKIKDAMNPVFDGDEPVNPFDFWEGADFHMKITNVEGWVNYDKSHFRDKRVLSEDDAKLEEIYNGLTPLSSLIAPDKFKSYAELKAKLNRVLCIEAEEPVRPSAPAPTVSRDPDEFAPTRPAPSADPAPAADDDDDDTLSFFQGLADED